MFIDNEDYWFETYIYTTYIHTHDRLGKTRSFEQTSTQSLSLYIIEHILMMMMMIVIVVVVVVIKQMEN